MSLGRQPPNESSQKELFTNVNDPSRWSARELRSPTRKNGIHQKLEQTPTDKLTNNPATNDINVTNVAEEGVFTKLGNKSDVFRGTELCELFLERKLVLEVAKQASLNTPVRTQTRERN